MARRTEGVILTKHKFTSTKAMCGSSVPRGLCVLPASATHHEEHSRAPSLLLNCPLGQALGILQGNQNHAGEA